MNVKACRSCKRAIIWTRTHKGKRMPVDADPREDGNIVLREDPTGRVIAEYPGKEHATLFNDDRRPRYVSHFATCPERNDWRKS